MTGPDVIPDDIDAHIDSTVRTFIVSHRKDGSPTCHPMARFYVDRGYYMNMYAASVKHRNLERTPHRGPGHHQFGHRGLPGRVVPGPRPVAVDRRDLDRARPLVWSRPRGSIWKASSR